MSILVRDTKISTIGLIDDDVSVRQGYRYSTEDLDLEAGDISGPIRSIAPLIAESRRRFDAMICDYNLKTKNYSFVNGDELCVQFYRNKLPTVLCTRFEGSLPLPIRKNRRFIPVVIAPMDLDADVLVESLEICIDELAGKYLKTREPYRAMLRIEGGEIIGLDRSILLNIIVPSWNSAHMFTMEIDPSAGEAYEAALVAVKNGEVARMFADVNLDAEVVDDLFVSEWRLR